MVKKNEYPRKNYAKDDAQAGEPAHSNSQQQKTFQKDEEFHHKENRTRSTRPPRDNQQRDNSQQRENQQRDTQKKENTPRDNQQKENSQRDTSPRDNQHKDNHQRNFHRDNSQNRESREPYRQHFQRPAIKPRADETVEDIASDISRIEKEIDLELKEIKSMRLGV